MNYKERFTERFYDVNGIASYCADDREMLRIFDRLGFYEDMGFAPDELADMLVQYEMMKPRSEWDMDKIDKWVAIKKNYYKYIKAHSTGVEGYSDL